MSGKQDGEVFKSKDDYIRYQIKCKSSKGACIKKDNDLEPLHSRRYSKNRSEYIYDLRSFTTRIQNGCDCSGIYSYLSK